MFFTKVWAPFPIQTQIALFSVCGLKDKSVYFSISILDINMYMKLILLTSLVILYTYSNVDTNWKRCSWLFTEVPTSALILSWLSRCSLVLLLLLVHAELVWSWAGEAAIIKTTLPDFLWRTIVIAIIRIISMLPFPPQVSLLLIIMEEDVVVLLAGSRKTHCVACSLTHTGQWMDHPKRESLCWFPMAADCKVALEPRSGSGTCSGPEAHHVEQVLASGDQNHERPAGAVSWLLFAVSGSADSPFCHNRRTQSHSFWPLHA